MATLELKTSSENGVLCVSASKTLLHIRVTLRG